MDWQYSENGDSLARVAGSESVSDVMIALCLHIGAEVLPKNRDVAWDHLRVDIWSDSGQFIVFPASAATPHRIEKVACQIIFDELSKRFMEWGDNMNEDEFDRRIADEERRYFSNFVDAARKTDLLGICVKFSIAGDDPIEEIVL